MSIRPIRDLKRKGIMPSAKLRNVKFKCPHCGKTISEKLVKSHAATVAGKASAKKNAARDPEYYSNLSKMRKNPSGGRPRKTD